MFVPDSCEADSWWICSVSEARQNYSVHTALVYIQDYKT